MSFRDGLEAIRSGNDDGSFTVIARHMAAEPERVSSAAFLLASSAWHVRAEDASAQHFFADVSKELCDLTEEEMGRMEKEELQRQIYMAAYETYALDRVRDQV